MNKQLVLFLSLFSVLLLVSVYYITSPVNEQLVSKNDILYEERNERDMQVATLKKEQSTIIAASTSSENDKKMALMSLTNLSNIENKQSEIEHDLAQMGYSSVVFFDSKKVKIKVSNKTSTSDEAANILAKAMESLDDSYIFELNFKLQ